MKPSPLSKAVLSLKKGTLWCYPTEAVYGVGCIPEETAITELLTLKQRAPDKGFILVAAHIEQILPYADFSKLTSQQYISVVSSWPGPYTWILPAHPSFPSLLKRNDNTIAIRISAHPIVRQLCEELQSALISTSANKSNCPAARSLKEVQSFIIDTGNRIQGIVAGPLGGARNPTTIRDARTGETLRS